MKILEKESNNIINSLGVMIKELEQRKQSLIRESVDSGIATVNEDSSLIDLTSLSYDELIWNNDNRKEGFKYGVEDYILNIENAISTLRQQESFHIKLWTNETLDLSFINNGE